MMVACGPTVALNGDTPMQGSSTTDDPVTGSTSEVGSTSVTGSTSSLDSSADGSTSSGEPDLGGSETTSATACPSPHFDPDDLLALADAPIRGNPDGAVTIVEWVNYVDTYTAQAETTLEQLFAGELGPEIRLVVKQNPLEFVTGARDRARAALAAGNQGAFWEYHDALFVWNEAGEEPPLDQIAMDLGLDMAQFNADRASVEIEERIDADIQLLEAVHGIIAAPAFAINGMPVLGAQSLMVFENVVGNEQEAFWALVAAGATRCEAYQERLAENLP